MIVKSVEIILQNHKGVLNLILLVAMSHGLLYNHFGVLNLTTLL